MIMPGKQVLYQGSVWEVEELVTRTVETGHQHDAAKIWRQYYDENEVSHIDTKTVPLRDLKEVDGNI